MHNGWKNDDEDRETCVSENAVLPIKASRAAKNDLIIVCTSKSTLESAEKIVKRFGVEKAVLACHSAFFNTGFETFSNANDEGEIELPEQPEVVSSFLKCIYGTDIETWNFE